ncbi:MAG: zinc ribbon domain-containing protein [Sedimentisphaerales bacterium]|nr:zinc ribbon domain-containing protein [Sedimentisphaerales bacterium]
MPTYEYKCENCEHLFEHFQSMTSKPLRKCPECGKNKLIRLIGSGAGIIFKGTGFYQTDYRSDSYKKSAESDKKPSSTTTEKKDSTTKEPKKESKTAEKKSTPKSNKKAESK